MTTTMKMKRVMKRGDDGEDCECQRRDCWKSQCESLRSTFRLPQTKVQRRYHHHQSNRKTCVQTVLLPSWPSETLEEMPESPSQKRESQTVEDFRMLLDSSQTKVIFCPLPSASWSLEWMNPVALLTQDSSMLISAFRPSKRIVEVMEGIEVGWEWGLEWEWKWKSFL